MNLDGIQRNNAQIAKIEILGFTVVELLIGVAIIGLLAMIAVPAYQGYIERAESGEAVTDILSIQLAVDDYELTNGSFPNSLAEVGMAGATDPWGRPYVYANHANIPPGHRRKDKNLVPINSDYDLYSSGEDGASVGPLTAKPSRDDIVRASNGSYVGIAEDY